MSERSFFSICLAAFILLLTAMPCRAALSFTPAVNYPVGDFPYGLTSGDFNGDGIIDLATANGQSRNVTILLGVGDGTFSSAGNFAAGYRPVSVTKGDFNGDGKIDLAVANSLSDNISILLGRGDGTFSVAVNYAVGDFPYFLSSGDFDGDGNPDLVVPNAWTDNISILMGVGNGTFRAAVNYNVGSFPTSATSMDFNRDGKIDLAVTNSGSDNVSILLGVGDGTFNAPVNYPAGDSAYHVISEDFNGDGEADLAIANWYGSNMSILLGNGDGTFDAAVNYRTGGNSASVVMGDFDGDGKTDLAVPNTAGDNVSLLLGLGNGTFDAAVNYTVGDGPFSAVSEDFNGDGMADLAVSNGGNDTVSIMLNQATRVNQTITFPELPLKTFGDVDFDPGATASSGLTVSYTSSRTDVANISGEGIHIVGAGISEITASQAGNGDFNPAPDVQRTLTVNKADQTISFQTLPVKTFGDADFNPGATASSGLGVSYTSSSLSVATIAERNIHIVGVGTSVITASQAGDANFNAAPNIQQTLLVNSQQASVPGAPTGVTATPGNAQAAVNFTAPASTGGGPIIFYTVKSSPGDKASTGPGSPIAVTGLINGTSYTFTVTASNAIGTSRASDPSAPVIPLGVPGAPTNVRAIPGNANATVSFTAPASNGGSPIISYTVRSNRGETASGNASPIMVTGLHNGSEYTFTVTATNAIGAGPASSDSNQVTPATLPGAPRGVTATPGTAQATVHFTHPESNGGNSIFSYTVTSDKGHSASRSDSPITVTGLTNGTPYTFTVKARNRVGAGPASNPSNFVTPANLPGKPAIRTAKPGNEQVTVEFTAPPDGGSPITFYTVTSDRGNRASGNASPITVTGLTNGTPYRFMVLATNAIGTGPASNPSAVVIPATVPGAPTNVRAIPGNAIATVSFTAPPSNGGRPILSYTVRSNRGETASGTGSPITVAGLNNRTSYTFTVTAKNKIGTSPASDPSNSITPGKLPGKPTNVTATAGNARATVYFTYPRTGGGSITSYTVTSNRGQIASDPRPPITVTGLTNGTSYTFTVTATNAVGTGPASDPTSPVIPATVPGAPVITTATAGDAKATVTFTTPADGGSTIAFYTVTASPGGNTQTGPGSPITVTGLTNCTACTFTVTATNAMGTGPGSSPSSSVTPILSSCPEQQCYTSSYSCPEGCSYTDKRTTLNILESVQRLVYSPDERVDLYFNQSCQLWIGHFTQIEEPHENYCGPTAGKNLLEWYGETVDYEQLGREMRTNDWMSSLDVALTCSSVCSPCPLGLCPSPECLGICAWLLPDLLDVGTLPEDMEKTLNRHTPLGYRLSPQHKQYTGLDTFKPLLREGNPIVVLLYTGSTLHWTVITGTYVQSDGTVMVRFANYGKRGPLGRPLWDPPELPWDTFVYDWSLDGMNEVYRTIVKEKGVEPYIWMYYERTTELRAGQSIMAGGAITSHDGRFELTLQTDGNLVLYDSGHNRLWASDTVGANAYEAVMQDDGNFVIYDPNHNDLWRSGTSGHPGAYLALQDDGNIVIYDAENSQIWATSTAGH